MFHLFIVYERLIHCSDDLFSEAQTHARGPIVSDWKRVSCSRLSELVRAHFVIAGGRHVCLDPTRYAILVVPPFRLSVALLSRPMCFACHYGGRRTYPELLERRFTRASQLMQYPGPAIERETALYSHFRKCEFGSWCAAQTVDPPATCMCAAGARPSLRRSIVIPFIVFVPRFHFLSRMSPRLPRSPGTARLALFPCSPRSEFIQAIEFLPAIMTSSTAAHTHQRARPLADAHSADATGSARCEKTKEQARRQLSAEHRSVCVWDVLAYLTKRGK